MTDKLRRCEEFIDITIDQTGAFVKATTPSGSEIPFINSLTINYNTENEKHGIVDVKMELQANIIVQMR